VLYRAEAVVGILVLMQVDADDYSAAASGFSREPAFITRNFDSVVLYQVIHFLVKPRTVKIERYVWRRLNLRHTLSGLRRYLYRFQVWRRDY